MTLSEANQIWNEALEYIKTSDTIATKFSNLPPGGVIEVAEAFAIMFLQSEKTPAHLDHFRTGLGMLVHSAPDHFIEISEGEHEPLPKLRDIYSALNQKYSDANEYALTWFDYRIHPDNPDSKQ